MRHSKRRHKLGVSGPHRLALLANLSVALITHGRIKTTLAKAKALRPFIEKIITMAKKAEAANEPERKLHFRRLAISRLNNPAAVATLFDDRVSEFMERPGGYTRIYKLGQRIGDAAEMGLIELIDGNDEGYPKKSSKKKDASKSSKANHKENDTDDAQSSNEKYDEGISAVEDVTAETNQEDKDSENVESPAESGSSTDVISETKDDPETVDTKQKPEKKKPGKAVEPRLDESPDTQESGNSGEKSD